MKFTNSWHNQMAVIDKLCPNVIVEPESLSKPVLLLLNGLHSNTFVNKEFTIDGRDAIAWCNTDTITR